MAEAGATSPAAAAGGERALRLTDKLKEQFKERVVVTAVRVPKKATAQYMKLLSKHLLNKPRLKNIMEDAADPESRLVLLEEGLQEAGFAERQVDGKGQPAGRTLADVVREDGLAVTTASVDVDYSYWPAHTILQRLLPAGLEAPSAFEQVGHIAHLNLREELLPFKFLIGQVVLDKHPSLQTVVNKVASIQNEFRVFPMELLAGRACTETEVRQHGARFKLDFRKVYWNSRLEREHQRLVGLFRPGEVVLDAMAGIGPFAIPAAQKGCLVYANDLNPASFEYLCTNIKLNRLGGKVLPFNADGREFMRQAAAGKLDVAAAAAVVPPAPPKQQAQKGKQQGAQAAAAQAAAAQGAAAQGAAAQGAAASDAQQQQPQQAAQQQQLAISLPDGRSRPCQHIVMNLPASAVEFLDALHGSFSPAFWEGQALPLVHVYTFAKGEEELAGLRQRVESHLGGQLDDEPQVHLVRDVAPKKLMVAVTFRLPPSIAFAGAAADEPAKRQRTE